VRDHQHHHQNTALYRCRNPADREPEEFAMLNAQVSMNNQSPTASMDAATWSLILGHSLSLEHCDLSLLRPAILAHHPCLKLNQLNGTLLGTLPFSKCRISHNHRNLHKKAPISFFILVPKVPFANPPWKS
jgi:hypothetical protein